MRDLAWHASVAHSQETHAVSEHEPATGLQAAAPESPLTTPPFAAPPGERVPDFTLERPRDPEWYRRALISAAPRPIGYFRSWPISAPNRTRGGFIRRDPFAVQTGRNLVATPALHVSCHDSNLVRQKCLKLADELGPGGLMGQQSVVLAVERHELGVWDRGGKAPALLERDEGIADAMKDDRGHLDLGKQVGDVDIVHGHSQLHRIFDRVRDSLKLDE